MVCMQGGYGAEATGFTLNSLLKLHDIRASQPARTTLMHYVAMVTIHSPHQPCACWHYEVQLFSLTLWRQLLSYVPDQVKPSFVIFDIRALWRSTLPVTMGMTGEWVEELMSSMPCQSCVNLTVIGRCVFDELIDACTTHKQLFAANFYWLMRLWSR